jgi:ATP-binding cassette subfamily F protein 3
MTLRARLQANVGRLAIDVEIDTGPGTLVVVGPNGAGKSTLLRILAGRQRQLAGVVELGHGARCGYYDQDAAELDPEGTAYALVRRAHGELTDQEIRGHLARFLFRGDEVDKPVPALSGGERARLALALLMLESVSWLALDEPTNHLDLGARTALEEMLGAFDGALVCVSHDRAFLDGLCTHVLEVGAGDEPPELFTGNYTEWRADRAAHRASAQERAQERAQESARRARASAQKEGGGTRTAASKGGDTGSRPADRVARASGGGSGGRVRNPYMFEKLEARIMALEEALEGLHAEVATEEVYRDPGRLKELQITIAERERELAAANDEWEAWETT